MKRHNIAPEFVRVSQKDGRAFLLDYYQGGPHFRFHYHTGFELAMTRGSSGRRIIGDDTSEYSNRDLILCGPNLPHAWAPETTESSDNIVCHFTMQSIGMDFMTKPELDKVKSMLNSSKKGLQFSQETIAKVEPLMVELTRIDGLEQLLNFLSILNILSLAENVRPIASDKFNSSFNEQDQIIFAEIIKYIHKNNAAPISLDEIAAHVNMSVSTFTRFFKRMTGKGFVSYLNEWRVNRACILLHETDMQIVKIALESGFKNLSLFNRIFLRQMKMTPRQYRKNRRTGTTEYN